MTRSALEHLLRAASAISQDRDILVFGSQAILGTYPTAPAELLISREADVFPLNRPEEADTIDAVIGELSSFDQTFGYYAHGVSPQVATMPKGWRERLVRLANDNTGARSAGASKSTTSPSANSPPDAGRTSRS